MRFKPAIQYVTPFVMALALSGILQPSAVQAAGEPRPAEVKRQRIREHITTASWYGWGFARRRTASGEPFNPMALTAAHKTLPLGSRVRVTNLRNGRSVVVRINDRGPYHGNRGIDVSKEAARQLRMVSQGVAKVKIEELPVMPYAGPVATAMAALPCAPSAARAVSL